MFGASRAAPATVNALAFQKASEFLPEGGTLWAGPWTYKLIGPVPMKPVNIEGSGQGATIFEFDNTVPANGFNWRTPTNKEVLYGVTFASFKTVNGHGLDCNSTSKEGHNAKKPKIRFEHLSFYSEDTENPDDSFAQKWSWQWMFHLGDAWDLTLDDIDASGSYLPEIDATKQSLDGFVRFNPTQGILSGRIRDITTHNVANGIEIRRKTYLSGYTIDIARAWRGIYDAPDREFEANRYAYGEGKWDFVVVNAQKKCIDLKNRFATTFDGIVCHRAGGGHNHGTEWVGLRLDDSMACDVSKAEVVPANGYTGEQVGVDFAGGIGPTLTNYHPGIALTHALRISGRTLDDAACQAPIINGVVPQGSMAGVLFDLVEARGARISNISKASSHTIGTFVQYGNVATRQSCFFLQAPTDNTLEFDDDFFWVRANGGVDAKRWRWQAGDNSLTLASQGDTFNVGVSALIFNRSGIDVTKAELRTSASGYTLLNSPDNQVAGVFKPTVDNSFSLGSASFRWVNIFGATGAISTSDRNVKCEISDIPDAWLDAWGDVEWCRFKFNDAVEEKGLDNARWHTGLIAQDIHAAFAARGIDAFEIGLLCEDEWNDQYREEVDDLGELSIKLILSAGSIYGIRHDEAQALEAAFHRREIARLKQMIEHLS